MAVSERFLTIRFAERIVQAKPFENREAMSAAKNGIIDFLLRVALQVALILGSQSSCRSLTKKEAILLLLLLVRTVKQA